MDISQCFKNIVFTDGNTMGDSNQRMEGRVNNCDASQHYGCLREEDGTLRTVVRDDPPGGEGGVEAPAHPEHAEPAQVLPALVHLQELREVCVHDGNRTPDAVRSARENGGVNLTVPEHEVGRT